jgi:TIR domain
MPHLVFISHGSHDAWIAQQMARCVGECSVETFLDVNDIATGDEFKEVIRTKISQADELVALFTPFSRDRSWLWVEIGAAWYARKRLVAVLFGMTMADLERDGGGRAILTDIHSRPLNAFDGYLDELRERVLHG